MSNKFGTKGPDFSESNFFGNRVLILNFGNMILKRLRFSAQLLLQGVRIPNLDADILTQIYSAPVAKKSYNIGQPHL